MNSHDRTKAMIESALITAIAVIFTLAGIYIPILGSALIFLPVPFIIIGVKYGIKYNILSVVTVSIVIGALTGPVSAMFVSIIGGISAITMGYMIEKKYEFSKTMIYAVIVLMLSTITSLTLISYFAGFNVKEVIEEIFTISSDINQSLLKGLGSNPQKFEEMKQMMEHLKNTSLMLLPSSIIFVSVLFTYLNYIVSGAILKRMGKTIEKPNRFSHFSLPRSILMGSFLILILTYLLGQWGIVNFEMLFTNVLYLFFIVYLIQGLAVANFFLEKRGFGRGLKIIIIVLLITIPNAAIILMFVGLFDIIFNIRKLEK